MNMNNVKILISLILARDSSNYLMQSPSPSVLMNPKTIVMKCMIQSVLQITQHLNLANDIFVCYVFNILDLLQVVPCN